MNYSVDVIGDLSPNPNLSLINTIYHRPMKGEDGQWRDGLTLVVKDNDTGEKFHKTIIDPLYEYFQALPEYTPDTNVLFIEQDKVIPRVCKYREREKDIAENTDNMEFFYDNIKSGNRSNNRQLHTHTSLFMSDMDINDYYRFRFNQKYGINDTIITKSFLDIEVDIIDIAGDFPEPGEAPINAVTVVDGTSNKVYTFLLRNRENELIQEFEDELNTNPNDFFTTMRNTLIDSLGGYDNFANYGFDKLENIIKFYDEEDEIILIKDIFNLINSTKVDFVLAWNMGFDIPYIIQRIINLGYDPAEIMCDEDFLMKEAWYYVDTRNSSDFHLRGDYSNISSNTVYIDQLIHFASRRAGQGTFANYKLDYIGEVIAKARKLSYTHITTQLAKLPYLDYKTFVMYNIIDTMVQKAIEMRTEDIEFVYNKSVMNNCRFEKCHRNTIYLKNRATSEFLRYGIVIGSNGNINNEKVPYAGGMVTEPHLNLPNGVVVDDVVTTLYRNVDDYDYKSLYPSTVREFNISPNTQIGKLYLHNILYKNNNQFDDTDYDDHGAFMEMFISRNFLVLCNRYMEMGSYMEVLDDIIEYYENKGCTLGMLTDRTLDGLLIPMSIVEEKMIQPMKIDTQYERLDYKPELLKIS